MGLMDGKVALVTGAGRGIGRAVALNLAAAGAKVVVNDFGGGLHGEATEQTPADEVVAEIKAQGGEAAANQGNVADADDAAGLVQTAIDSFGQLDAVVNVAGILRDSYFHKMTPEDWKSVIDVHLNGTYNVARAAMDIFRAQESGAYVHFTSTSGLVGNAGQANYAAAKMGIVGLSRVIAMEGARFNVRSNCVSPFAWTRMIEAIPVTSDEMADAFEKFRQNASAEHIAPVCTYLVSDAAKDVTGNIFGVRGNEIYLMSQPRPIRTLHKGDGWTPEDLAATLEPALRHDLYGLEGSGEYYSWDPI
ncbi:MAG: SDR family oxidoreductase [Rhodospirillaceae bacterium]|jgi:NAD(P)-dependent dehydrogenase (short-subunit alcohol dehydrogenase family)|nr:SDR family oxidoreductase [Rhodospirillaceae bacterium]MBT4688797.1 SDR family oxidoreductase [Rhodospirillaceae bacterium]MBT5083377.1 SDR family oxidoreductase [Rhodospirillaceae bacterium]MBT5525573.1 SDR family oxidoreductase [Rhodospirillaceae bacterium]MBT5880575.1 SDR family oxidoreductase [Rhodospirillaceae bacterium]